jgi:methionyl-tRNA formyltransferase
VSLRIVFFGTPAFAVPTFESLRGSAHTIVAAVTQPDKPSGRGRHVSFGAVKAAALRHEVPVLQPPRLKDPGFLAALDALRADLGVVAAYGKLLPAEVLAAPRLGLLNVHASLLPRYRGAAPVHRAVMQGEPETGVTIMRVVQALDAGPMLAAVRRPIGADETSADVEGDLARMGATLLRDVVDRVAAGDVDETAQDEQLATYAPRITKEDGIIDWNRPARAVHDQVRGLHPWPHAFSWLDSKRVMILQTKLTEAPHAGPPGRILEAHGDRLTVAAGAGTALAIQRLQLEGGKPLTARDFLAGHRLDTSSRFTTPGP